MTEGVQLLDGAGTAVGLDTLAGRTLLLHYSGHWCGECQAYTPQLVEAYTRLKARGKNVLAVFISLDRCAAKP